VIGCRPSGFGIFGAHRWGRAQLIRASRCRRSTVSTTRTRSCAAVGHSLGGALSLAFALRHPQRVAGLALIAPLTTFSARCPRFSPGCASVAMRCDASLQRCSLHRS
jgi:pimeloyl-ACP methyl ester carboxylesterase